MRYRNNPTGFIFRLPVSLNAETIPVSSASEELTWTWDPRERTQRDLYGYGACRRKNIAVGEWGTWELVYHVGRLGVDDGGRIFLLFNAVADWGSFQFDDPRAAGYVSVHTDGNALVTAHGNSRHAGPRPYWGGIIITVREGNLVKGTKYLLHWAIEAVAAPVYARLQSFRTLPTSSVHG